MPPVVAAAAAAPALFTAGATIATGVGGALLANRGAGQAADAQERAAAQALAFEREQAAEDKRRYEEAQVLQRAQYEAKQAQLEPFLQGRYAVLGKYGIPPPQRQPMTLRDVAGGSQGAPGGPQGPRRFIPGPANQEMPPEQELPPPGITLRDLPNWSDRVWSMQGRG